EERDRFDELQVLRVIAPGARPVVQEGELTDVGVDDVERPEEALRVVVAAMDLDAFLRRPQALQRLRPALQLVDPPRLLASLVDRQDKRAVEELLVDLYRRRRQEDHHRPFDAVLLRDETARARILASRRDRDLAL